VTYLALIRRKIQRMVGIEEPALASASASIVHSAYEEDQILQAH
jgi:hypothetical protein